MFAEQAQLAVRETPGMIVDDVEVNGYVDWYSKARPQTICPLSTNPKELAKIEKHPHVVVGPLGQNKVFLRGVITPTSSG